MFWGAVEAIVNAADVQGTERPLVVSRNKALVRSVDEDVITNEFDSFQGLDMANS